MSESFLTLMADYCPEDQQRLFALYNALQDAGFTGSQTPGLPLHVSLATFPLNREADAIRVTREAAARFAPRTVAIRHVGVMPGGRVLFAAPDMDPALTALQQACGGALLNDHLWLPHTTMLIDEPQTIAAALPVLMERFTPITARLTRLHLCAFWPTREILAADLTGAE